MKEPDVTIGDLTIAYPETVAYMREVFAVVDPERLAKAIAAYIDHDQPGYIDIGLDEAMPWIERLWLEHPLVPPPADDELRVIASAIAARYNEARP